MESMVGLCIYEKRVIRDLVPEIQSMKEQKMDFMLSNGQLDYYPLFYVLPTEQVMKAPNYFERNHKLPEFITWHDDAFL